jgi:hypothetical protein
MTHYADEHPQEDPKERASPRTEGPSSRPDTPEELGDKAAFIAGYRDAFAREIIITQRNRTIGLWLFMIALLFGVAGLVYAVLHLSPESPPVGRGSAKPESVLPGDKLRFEVSTDEGANPASPVASTVCNLTPIGGPATFPVNGEYNVPANVTPKVYSLPCVVTDGRKRRSTFYISLTVVNRSSPVQPDPRTAPLETTKGATKEEKKDGKKDAKKDAKKDGVKTPPHPPENQTPDQRPTEQPKPDAAKVYLDKCGGDVFVKPIGSAVDVKACPDTKTAQVKFSYWARERPTVEIKPLNLSYGRGQLSYPEDKKLMKLELVVDDVTVASWDIQDK